ncbi:MAG: putative hydroxymethylpyrimidine transporter CytX [Anaerolineales bacterium]|jgi:putative hydroxymethylpyrimidine transporter CytX
MAQLAEGWRRLRPKLHAPPEWGIEPVSQDYRVLGFLDYLVLWGDLGIGLLVLLAGSFLVPGLGLGSALLAIAVGSILGALMLSLIGILGSENALPTMVLLRPALGVRGSYLPSALNVLQLIGWTIFEFVLMGYAANAISRIIFGSSNLLLWTAVFAAIVILMGVGGPIGFVRQWLEKFAVWIVVATTVWLTWHLLTSSNIVAIFTKPGNGSLPFWSAVDLVIAMPISWLPLVADYSRFARRTSRAFWGTFVGFALTNIWFYALGAFILLAAGFSQQPKEFVSALALSAGWIAFLILLLDETDNAWADLYSAAVSLQNVLRKIKQRWLILGLGLFSFLVAVFLDITQYQNFLYLIGSIFTPLFGLLAADYFLLRNRRYQKNEIYRPQGAYWYRGGVNVFGMVAWVAGILVYNVAAPATLGVFIPQWVKIVPPSFTLYGGSIPSFIAAFGIYAVLGFAFRRIESSTWIRRNQNEKEHSL